jgi:hypothetical protein
LYALVCSLKDDSVYEMSQPIKLFFPFFMATKTFPLFLAK